MFESGRRSGADEGGAAVLAPTSAGVSFGSRRHLHTHAARSAAYREESVMKKIGTLFALALVSSFAVGCSANFDPAPGPLGSEGPAPVPTVAPPASTGPATPASPSDPMAPAPVAQPGEAMLRVVHASADAPVVDVYPAGSSTPVVTGLGYGQTTGWILLKPGPYAFEIRAAGAKPTDPIVYRTPTLTLPDASNVSAVAAGLVGAKDADATFRVVPVVESFGPKLPGKVRVRAIHAGADAPAVDLDVGNDDPAAPEVNALQRFADTGPAGVELAANQALAIGIAAGGQRVTSFSTPKLPDGAQVLLVATGLLGKLGRERDGFSLLAIGGMGSVGFVKQDPIVYALHASADAPRVDAFFGATELVSDIGFGQISKPAQVPPGDYKLDFFPATAGNTRPSGTPAASGKTGNLEAGERYLATATGFLTGLGAQAFQLAGYREGFAIDDTKASLRAVHASPDAPAVDIGLVNGNAVNPVLFPDLSFTRASDDKGFAAPLAHLAVGVTPTRQNGSIVARFTVPAVSSPRAFVVAAGALATRPSTQSFRLLVVDTKPSPWTVTALFPH